MVRSVFFASAVAVVAAHPTFEEWAATYNVNTNGDDAMEAKYNANTEVIDKLNAEDNGATFAVNQFSGMTFDEFAAAYLTNTEPDAPQGAVTYLEEDPLAVSVDSIDWVAKGGVTPVKDQGQCGSCWAFSSASTIESAWAIAGHPLTPLSEQELVSCIAVTPPGGQCHGGLPSLTFDWLVKQRSGDVLTESFYPYASHDFWSPPCDHVCHGLQNPGNDQWCSTSCYSFTPLCPAESCDCTSDGKNVGATISSWRTLPSDEEQLRAWVASHGPISIGVDSMSAWQHYQGGIVTNCAAGMNDHAVNIVGFGEEDGSAFWIIRNSWNADWGEKGYMRVEFGTNQCNLKNEPTTVIVGSGGSISV